tara:strand:+ start:4701 stop:5606 length:906 start_codon:yes stop_codon:yes gene_type:complete
MFDHLLEPLSYVLDPSKRVFWAYVVGALIVACVVTARAQGYLDIAAQLRSLFSGRYWFNRSTSLDYLLLFVNGTIRTLLIIPVLGSHLAGAFVVASFLQRNVADPAVTGLPWLAVAALFSVTLFVCDDASRFALHRAMHSWGPLWRLHSVHHSATTLTPFTVFRVHPIESICYYTRGLLVFSIVAGVFIWVFKGKLTALEIMGVDALGFVFNLAAANLRHSHIYVGFGRLEAHIISPAQHQLHHSLDHKHPNFGSCLAWWDRLAGTLAASKGNRVRAFGIAKDPVALVASDTPPRTVYPPA